VNVICCRIGLRGECYLLPIVCSQYVVLVATLFVSNANSAKKILGMKVDVGYYRAYLCVSDWVGG